MIEFVVGNPLQVANASAVARFIGPGACRFLNLWSLRSTDEAPSSMPGHTPPLSLRAVREASDVSFSGDDVIVLPQDTGVLQRALAAAARRAGARIVLLPDGVITSARINTQSGAERWLLDQLDRVGRARGVLAGRPGVWGATQPDLALLWGSGWSGYLNGGMPVSSEIVGCPRMDGLRDVPAPPDEPSVLVCSQPLHVGPDWVSREAEGWYVCLERLFADPSPRLRLRLHPRELQDDLVPASLKDVASTQSMEADIAGASLMAAPFSTTLLEAAGCGRGVVMLPCSPEVESRSREFAFLSPSWVPVVSWHELTFDRLVACENVGPRMADDYLVNIGGASEAAAAAVLSL